MDDETKRNKEEDEPPAFSLIRSALGEKPQRRKRENGVFGLSFLASHSIARVSLVPTTTSTTHSSPLTMRSLALVALLLLLAAGELLPRAHAACRSDIQLQATYDQSAIYPNPMTLTFTATDTTGQPTTGLPGLTAAISIASGCNFANTPTPSCGSYNSGSNTWTLANFGYGSTPSCTLTFTANPSTPNDCAASIVLTNDMCTNSFPTTASTVVSPRVYTGVPMSTDIFIYYSTTISWTLKNSPANEQWNIYLQLQTPSGSWGAFRSSRYPVDGTGTRNVLVTNLPPGTTSYNWKSIANILPAESNLYRVIIQSNTSPPATVTFFNGEDQFRIRIKPLRQT